MTEILHKTVVLVGMMGAGKTAIGTELARMLGVPFVDSDDEIVRAANMSIPEIFARDGEAFFRLKEAQVIARLLRGPPGVLSVGGGAFLSAETRARITGLGVSVWLRADLDLLWTRVRQKTSRPLLRTANPRQTLAELLAQRDPVYALADLKVDARAEYTIAEMARQVCAALLSRPDVVQRMPDTGGTDGAAPARPGPRARTGSAKAPPLKETPAKEAPDGPQIQNPIENQTHTQTPTGPQAGAQTASAGQMHAVPRNKTTGAPARRNGGQE